MAMLAFGTAVSGASGAFAASADVSCTYKDEGLPLLVQGNTLTINVGDDDTGVEIFRAGTAIKLESVVFDEEDEDVDLHPLSCSGGTPTVMNVDTVRVSSPRSADFAFADLDLSHGPLAPGATNEGDGSSEIEVTADMKGDGTGIGVEGTSGRDRFVLGRTGSTTGANLNPVADGASPDVDITGLGGPFVGGGAGNDRITLSGGPGFSGPLKEPSEPFLDGAIVDGGSGNDRIVGSPGPDLLFGDSGRDTLYGLSGADVLDGGRNRDRLSSGRGPDFIEAFRHGRDRVLCGRGSDGANVDRHDHVSSCERRSFFSFPF